MEDNKFTILIQVDKEASSYKIKGNMTSGLVKVMIGELELIKLRLLSDLEKRVMIGELELIKLRLLSDLEKSLDNEKPTQRFEFD